MPIEVDSEIRILSEDEFHSMAEKVIGIVFGIHNDLGRLMDEELSCLQWVNMDNHDIEIQTLKN